MNKDKTELFENMPIPRAVAKLAIPTILSTLVMVLYNMADTYYVGLMKDPVESAAVTLAAPLLLAFNAVNNLFGIGASSLMSRSLGKKDYDTVRRTSSFSFYSAIFCALLISAAYLCFSGAFLRLLGADEVTEKATKAYLFWTVGLGACPSILNVVLSNMVRSEGSSLHASVGVISGCVLNMILDPFFILPQFLNMKAAGAGLATLLSNTLACLYFIVLLFIRRRESYVSLHPKHFAFDGYVIREVFGVGIPASVQNLLNVTGSIILNNFTAEFGPDAVSAMGIAHKINIMAVYVTMGLTQGIMPLISYNYASGNRRRMRSAVVFVAKISVAVAAALSLAFFLFAPQLVRLFLDQDSVVEIGKVLLRGMCLCGPFMGFDFMGVGVFQAIGKGSYSFVFAILRKLVFEIPAILLLNRLWPLYGMALAAPIAEFMLALAAFFMLRKILSPEKAAAGKKASL